MVAAKKFFLHMHNAIWQNVKYKTSKCKTEVNLEKMKYERCQPHLHPNF